MLYIIIFHKIILVLGSSLSSIFAQIVKEQSYRGDCSYKSLIYLKIDSPVPQISALFSG